MTLPIVYRLILAELATDATSWLGSDVTTGLDLVSKSPIAEHLKPFVPYVNNIQSNINPNECARNILPYPAHDLPVSRIKEWIRLCEHSHGDHCRPEATLSHYPLWLIDVKEECLRPWKHDLAYVALSYRWGPDQTCSVTPESLPTMQQPDSLSAEKLSLPPTIRQSMSVVRELGYCYLWVDALCIVEDKTKKSQLEAMGSIYSGASLTLIAAQGSNANSDLWTASAVSSSYESDKSSDLLDTDQHILDVCRADILSSDWWDRGWTFQEYLFSKRKLIFHGNTVNWECHCATWHEKQEQISTQPCEPDTKSWSAVPTWPDMHMFARIMVLFNFRQLTYPEDVMDAFAGILSKFCPSFDGGFVMGMPQLFFDTALLWQPFRKLTRRKPKKPGGNPTFLPSWSWAGWQGDIASESWRSGWNCLMPKDLQLQNQPPLVETIPTIQWHHSEEPHNPSKRQSIEASSGDISDAAVKDLAAAPLSNGWTRDARRGSLFAPFKHSAAQTENFRYPVSIRDAKSQPSLSHLSPYLYTETRHAQMIFGNPIKSDAGQDPVPPHLPDQQAYSLWRDGQYMGCLVLTEPESISYGSPCHLIELSAGRSSASWIRYDSRFYFPEFGDKNWPFGYGYEFYNVMWVEIRDGIGYRKGVGRVERSMWDRVASGKEETILN